MKKTVGKNYSTNQKEEDRNEHDYYPTKYSLTRQFLQKYKIPKEYKLYEPACGEAEAIMKVCKEFEYDIYGTDIIHKVDFLKSSTLNDWIITNPPFKLFNEFYYKSYLYSRYGFSLFGKIDFLTGKERFDFLYNSELRPNYIYVFNRKANLGSYLDDLDKYKTGIDGMAWFVKEKGNNNETIVRWIDNHEFVYKERINPLAEFKKVVKANKKYRDLYI